jgi:hypothetical protein
VAITSTQGAARVSRGTATVLARPIEPRAKGRTVSLRSPDFRSHRRVEFFRVPDHREPVPVWIFKPTDAIDAAAGLVMNLSDGGLQVLTPADEPLDGDFYEIQLLLGEDESVPRFHGRCTRVWSRESGGAGWLSGLRFDDAHSSAEDFIRTYQGAAPDRRWVRCLLIARA